MFAEKQEFVSKVVVLLGYENIETVAHLTLWELNNLLGYARRFLDDSLRRVDPGHVFMLGQSAVDHAPTSRNGELMTTIKNVGICWVHAGKTEPRNIVPLEFIGFQWFPVFCKPYNFDGFIQVCSFDTSRGSLDLPERKRHVVSGQAGNAMHVQVVGLSLLFAMLVCNEKLRKRLPLSTPLLHMLFRGKRPKI